jgi:hypothetical protein
MEAELREIASLLARGYLRLVGSRAAEIAAIAPQPEPVPGSPNCLDVAGGAKHELVPEGHP